MRVLIVDDISEKIKIIKAAINESGIEDLEIDAVGTIGKAVGELVLNETHILIADMKIPENYGDEPLPDGGLKLIDKVKNNKKAKTPINILLLTSVDEIYKDYQNEKIDTPYDFVYYDQSSEEWKKKIVRIIQKTKEYLLSTNNEIGANKYNYDIAIITVNPREKEALEKISRWKQIEIANDTTKYDETEWITKDGRKLKVVKTSPVFMGMVPAAVASMKLINHFTPRYIVMPGVAACIEKDYKIGDVLVGTIVYNYSAGKYSTPKGHEKEAANNPLKFWKPDSDGIETNSDIASIAQYDFTSEMDSIYTKWINEYIGEDYYHPENIPEVHGGIYACGVAVVQNKAIPELIKNHIRKAAGVDMESYGMYYAAKYCSRPRPIPVVIKSFSDMGDSDKNDISDSMPNSNKSEDDKRQEYAAFVSVNFMKSFISETLLLKIDQM